MNFSRGKSRISITFRGIEGILSKNDTFAFIGVKKVTWKGVIMQSRVPSNSYV
jgi:hypothetical protein